MVTHVIDLIPSKFRFNISVINETYITCQEPKSLDATANTALVTIGFLVMLVVLGTLLEFYIMIKEKIVQESIKHHESFKNRILSAINEETDSRISTDESKNQTNGTCSSSSSSLTKESLSLTKKTGSEQDSKYY